MIHHKPKVLIGAHHVKSDIFLRLGTRLTNILHYTWVHTIILLRQNEWTKNFDSTEYELFF